MGARWTLVLSDPVTTYCTTYNPCTLLTTRACRVIRTLAGCYYALAKPGSSLHAVKVGSGCTVGRVLPFNLQYSRVHLLCTYSYHMRRTKEVIQYVQLNGREKLSPKGWHFCEFMSFREIDSRLGQLNYSSSLLLVSSVAVAV